MAVLGKDFTFIWNIKNYSFSFYDPIINSPSFIVDSLAGTEWSLMLDSYKGKDDICCRIKRKIAPGPDRVVLDYELSFLSGDESALYSKIFTQKGYGKGEFDNHSELRVPKEVLKSNKNLFIPNDTLTIRCRMWNRKIPILEAERCFAETEIETECRTYIGTIEKFSNTEPGRKTLVCLKPSSMKMFFASMNFSVTDEGKLNIEMEPVDYGHQYKCQCKIFFRDVSGNEIKCGQCKFHGKKLQCVSLTLLKEHLIENKEYYLPNDVFTFECVVILATGKEIEKVGEETIFDATRINLSSLAIEQAMLPEDNSTEKIDDQNTFVDQGTQTIESDSNNAIALFDENHNGRFTTFKDNWISMFNGKILCDVKIITETETFLSHIAVLIARSPVFKTMFTIDMVEKKNHCVNIDDLDADTVRKMLLFMYSDTLENLEYASAKSLYFAADKYNIVSLKQRCSNFLKQNLQETNFCDILLLADKHRDQDLKNTIQDYIAKEGKAVLSSEDWKNLERYHPLLTTEMFRNLYLNNRGE